MPPDTDESGSSDADELMRRAKDSRADDQEVKQRTTPKRRLGRPSKLQSSKALGPQNLAQYGRLAVAAKVAGRIATEAENVRWVAENLVLPLREIDADSIPSRTAVGMLRWARTVGETDFWRNTWSKLLPTKADVEAQSRLRQATGELETLIDRVREAGLSGPAIPETVTTAAQVINLTVVGSDEEEQEGADDAGVAPESAEASAAG